MDITIAPATHWEIVYFCIKHHYAGRVPIHTIAYSVRYKGELCGVVVFGPGANHNIYKPYTRFGLERRNVIELVRVALNGKQPITTQVVSMCIRDVKKNYRDIKLIVSYADTAQGHNGTIYRALNFFEVKRVKTNSTCLIDGVPISSRAYYRSLRKSHSVELLYSVKRKFILPLCRTLRKKMRQCDLSE